MKKKILYIGILSFCFLFLVSCKKTESSNISNTNINEEIDAALALKFSEDTINMFKDNELLGYSSEVELGQYKNFALTVSKKEVTDEEIEAELDYYLSEADCYKKITEGIVEQGDRVNVAFVGYIDGEAFEGGSAENINVTVGEGAFIDGFEEALLGGAVGSTIEATVVFPQDYGIETLNGKEAVFKITLNYICGEKVSPEKTDEFIKNYTVFDSLDSLRENIRKDFDEYYTEDFENNLENYYWEAIQQELLKTCKIKSINKEFVYTYYQQTFEYYESMAASYGYAMETFCKTFMYCTLSEFKNDIAEMAVDYNCFMAIVDEIIKTENIVLTDDGYNNYLNKIVETYGYSSKEDLLNEIKSEGNEEEVKVEALRDVAVEFIVSNSTFSK